MAFLFVFSGGNDRRPAARTRGDALPVGGASAGAVNDTGLLGGPRGVNDTPLAAPRGAGAVSDTGLLGATPSCVKDRDELCTGELGALLLGGNGGSGVLSPLNGCGRLARAEVEPLEEDGG